MYMYIMSTKHVTLTTVISNNQHAEKRVQKTIDKKPLKQYFIYRYDMLCGELKHWLEDPKGGLDIL